MYWSPSLCYCGQTNDRARGQSGSNHSSAGSEHGCEGPAACQPLPATDRHIPPQSIGSGRNEFLPFTQPGLDHFQSSVQITSPRLTGLASHGTLKAGRRIEGRRQSIRLILGNLYADSPTSYRSLGPDARKCSAGLSAGPWHPCSDSATLRPI